MQLVGAGPVLDRPLARVLDRQGRGDHQHLAQAALTVGLQDHPRQPRVDRQPGELAADPRELEPRPVPATAVGGPGQRTELLQQLYAGAHGPLVGRVDEREPLDLAQPERGHLQDHAGQRGAQDLRLGELRAGLEVLLAVEPDRDAGLDPSAPPRALLRRGLADRLDRQPLHLGARRPATDPRETGVDHRGDAGHRQRGLGHVGRQHDAPPGVALEDPVLLGGGEPREQRHDVEAPAAPRPGASARRRCRGSPARRAGTRGCRRRCRASARRPRPRSPRSGRARPARPPRRRTTPRAAGGSAPPPGRSAR